jgi:integrase
MAVDALGRLLINAMMGKHTFRKRMVRKAHVKFEGIAAGTILRYKKAVIRFFNWRRSAGFRQANSLSELDYQASEFINFLYLDESPLGWAGDFVAGLKRLYPRCKRQLETTGTYYKSWLKATLRVRALPLTPELVRGLACIALIKRQPQMAAALLVAFTGLLRIGEILSMRADQVNCLRDNLVIISFPLSKGAQRKGSTETVLIRDPSVVRMLRFLKDSLAGPDLLFGGSYKHYRSFLSESAAFFCLVHPNLTAHGLRRGGATWHFGVHLSYDKTQSHGRWEHAKTARMYIDEAMAETGQASLPPEGVIRLRKANRVLPELINRHF